jgi:hypothetical protein
MHAFLESAMDISAICNREKTNKTENRPKMPLINSPYILHTCTKAHTLFSELVEAVRIYSLSLFITNFVLEVHEKLFKNLDAQDLNVRAKTKTLRRKHRDKILCLT